MLCLCFFMWNSANPSCPCVQTTHPHKSNHTRQLFPPVADTQAPSAMPHAHVTHLWTCHPPQCVITPTRAFHRNLTLQLTPPHTDVTDKPTLWAHHRCATRRTMHPTDQSKSPNRSHWHNTHTTWQTCPLWQLSLVSKDRKIPSATPRPKHKTNPKAGSRKVVFIVVCKTRTLFNNLLLVWGVICFFFFLREILSWWLPILLDTLFVFKIIQYKCLYSGRTPST